MSLGQKQANQILMEKESDFEYRKHFFRNLKKKVNSGNDESVLGAVQP